MKKLAANSASIRAIHEDLLAKKMHVDALVQSITDTNTQLHLKVGAIENTLTYSKVFMNMAH